MESTRRRVFIILIFFSDSQSIKENNINRFPIGKMPRKVFKLERKAVLLKELEFPEPVSIYQCLEKVLRLPSVASKRYLTNKVDRCVTGLIAQQQCVGPLHTPLADVAVTAISHFGYVSIGCYLI